MDDEYKKFKPDSAYGRSYYDRILRMDGIDIIGELDDPNSPRIPDPKLVPEFSEKQAERFEDLRRILGQERWDKLVERLQNIIPGKPVEDEHGILSQPEYVIIRLASDLKQFDDKSFLNSQFISQKHLATFFPSAVNILKKLDGIPENYFDFFDSIRNLYPEATQGGANNSLSVYPGIWRSTAEKLDGFVKFRKFNVSNYFYFLELYSLAKKADSEAITRNVPITDPLWKDIIQHIRGHAEPNYEQARLFALAQAVKPENCEQIFPPPGNWSKYTKDLAGKLDKLDPWVWIRKANDIKFIQVKD